MNEKCYIYIENGYNSEDQIPEYMLYRTFTGGDSPIRAAQFMKGQNDPELYAERIDENNHHSFWDNDSETWVS